MKKLFVLFCICTSALAQDFPDGMVAVEFNASFNKANEVSWLPKLTDCETQRVDIAADSRWSNILTKPVVRLHISLPTTCYLFLPFSFCV